MKKTCTKCRTEKPFEEFDKQKPGKFGRAAQCKVCKREHKMARYWKDPVAARQRTLDYINSHPDVKRKLAKTASQRTRNNREKVNAQSRKNWRENENRRIKVCLGNRLRLEIRRGKALKLCKSKELYGCPFEQLKSHLESLFKPGMTWQNHGKYGWHIDHIIPCDAFDLTDLTQQKQCFHYTNLQPLWWKENISKSNKIT